MSASHVSMTTMVSFVRLTSCAFVALQAAHPIAPRGCTSVEPLQVRSNSSTVPLCGVTRLCCEMQQPDDSILTQTVDAFRSGACRVTAVRDGLWSPEKLRELQARTWPTDFSPTRPQALAPAWRTLTFAAKATSSGLEQWQPRCQLPRACPAQLGLQWRCQRCSCEPTAYSRPC